MTSSTETFRAARDLLLAADREPSAELAQSIMAFCRERVAPYKRIRRVELRGQETAPRAAGRGVTEFWEEDFSW